MHTNFIPQQDYTLFNLIASGQVDWVPHAPARPQTEKARASYEKLWQPEEIMASYAIYINHNGPLSDVRVRRALALALPRDELWQFNSYFTPLQGIVPPTLPNYPHRDIWLPHKSPTPPPQFFNPELARQLLAEAGFPAGEGLPTFTLAGSQSGAVPTVLNIITQSWLNELGIQVETAQFEWNNFFNEMPSFNFYLRVTIANIPNPLIFLTPFDGGQLLRGYHNHNFSSLLRQAEASATLEELFALASEAERILVLEDQAVIPLFTYVYANLINLNKWESWQPNHRGLHTWVGIRLRDDYVF